MNRGGGCGEADAHWQPGVVNGELPADPHSAADDPTAPNHRLHRSTRKLWYLKEILQNHSKNF